MRAMPPHIGVSDVVEARGRFKTRLGGRICGSRGGHVLTRRATGMRHGGECEPPGGRRGRCRRCRRVGRRLARPRAAGDNSSERQGRRRICGPKSCCAAQGAGAGEREQPTCSVIRSVVAATPAAPKKPRRRRRPRRRPCCPGRPARAPSGLGCSAHTRKERLRRSGPTASAHGAVPPQPVQMSLQEP